ncbi:MAG: di-trans,poly-cis-decaprenylcistransferase, partial [Actinobacteria bacterium]
MVTLYVFSTENWGRAETEVSSLMSLFAGVIAKKASEVNKKGYRLRFLGRRDELPLRVLTSVREAEELTRDNEALDFYVALNYGGQAEIVDAVRRIVGDGLAPEEIDAATFARYLYAPDAPPVDLLIRTSGELRVSNFLLWSIAYAEFYF